MSDNNSDEQKSKLSDISKLSLETSDEERATASLQLQKKFKELAKGSAFMTGSTNELGGTSAFRQAMNSVSRLQEAMNSSGINSTQNQVRDAMKGIETTGIQSHLSTPMRAGMDRLIAEQVAMEEARITALSVLPQGYMDQMSGAETAASRLMEEMRENHRLMFQHVDTFADIRRSIETVTSLNLNSVHIPRMDHLYDVLGIDRIGSALAAADAASVLGFHSAFNDEILTATSLIGEQISAFNALQVTASAALRLGIPERLEGMLARSIAAQESLIDEYREAAKDAKIEASFQRRISTISMIINILLFLLSVALEIEERTTDKDAAVLANTEAVQELQQSFDSMAAQMKRMNDLQEAASADEQAADMAISDILRGIANSLADGGREGAESDDAEHLSDTAGTSDGAPPKID